MTAKSDYLIDVAVLLIFFNRPEQTKRVFDVIKKARPSTLFLYQDGPRINRNDMPGIISCRDIVEEIDWECDIYRMYQDKNMGCDPSEYIAQKWMFSHVDKGIVLEDDDVPSLSFFPFCKELLDRYEYDDRINMICGMNTLGTYDECPDDYFFAQGGSIWGWASWKRVIDQWTPDYEFLDDAYALRLLKGSLSSLSYKRLIGKCREHKMTGRAHYETILGSNLYLNGRVNIIPRVNMICNIGISPESTHSVSDEFFLPRAIRRVMNMNVHDLNFPLRHPNYVITDTDYVKKTSTLLNGNWFVRTFRLRKIESKIYRIFPFLGKMM